MSMVTCVGLAVQDLVFAMDEPVLLGEKNFASALGAIGGGPAANAAVAVARLGATPKLISVLGTDAIGDEIVAELAAHGVDCSSVRRVADAPSPLSAVVIAPDGDRTIFNRTDPRLWSAAPLPSAEEISGSDALLVDVRWGTGALASVRAAAEAGIPSVVDCDLTEGPISESLLAAASHVVFSQPAFERIRTRATSGAVEEVARRFGGVVAVTKGGDGVVWSDGGPAHVTPAFRIDAMDTLGAGDVFHGAYALGVAEGHPVDDIVEWASAVAAVKCSRPGGRTAFPTRTEVADFLERSRT